MTLHIDWLGTAEGAVLDSRGAPTLVGLNQNVITPEGFPVAWTSSIFVFVTEDPEDLPSDPEISGVIRIEFKDPRNEIISVSTQTIKTQRKYENIPATIAAAAQVMLAIQEPGRYTISATLKSSAEDIGGEHGEKYVYVIAPEQ